jgi:hypothetical protein
MRIAALTIICCGVAFAGVGCGEERAEPPVPLPSSGTTYRALSSRERVAVARSCRDRAVAAARGTAARQLRKVDPEALRGRLDDAYTIVAHRRRSVAEVCAEQLPFETPGLRLSFVGAKRFGGDGFTFETTSDKPLTIRGQVSRVPNGGRVLARREGETSPTYRATFTAGGRFALPTVHLRKQADNTFTLTIQAPPNAQRSVYFSALCLDCLAGATPSSVRR